MFESYSRMVKHLVETYYIDVTRYGTTGFLPARRRARGPRRGPAHLRELGSRRHLVADTAPPRKRA